MTDNPDRPVFDWCVQFFNDSADEFPHWHAHLETLGEAELSHVCGQAAFGAVLQNVSLLNVKMVTVTVALAVDAAFVAKQDELRQDMHRCPAVPQQGGPDPHEDLPPAKGDPRLH